MALYQVDIEKLYNGEYWTNVYHVEAADLAEASDNAQAITDIEIAMHYDAVTITKFRVSDVDPEAGLFNTKIINEPGGHSGSPEYLPLWNVIRVDFSVVGFRSCRKYMRPPLLEGQQTAGILGSATLTDWNTNYVNSIVTLGFVKNPAGNPIVDGQVFPLVGMHQLRRGSKRRLAPVIP